MDGRSGARAVAAQGFTETNAIGVRPQRMAGLRIVADDQLIFAPLFLGDGVPARGGECRPTEANRLTPHGFRARTVPVALQRNASNNAGAIRPEKLRELTAR